MAYTVAMVLLDRPEDAGKGSPSERLAGTFPTFEAAHEAGSRELQRRNLPPGSITFKVQDSNGQDVDEAGLGLS